MRWRAKRTCFAQPPDVCCFATTDSDSAHTAHVCSRVLAFAFCKLEVQFRLEAPELQKSGRSNEAHYVKEGPAKARGVPQTGNFSTLRIAARLLSPRAGEHRNRDSPRGRGLRLSLQELGQQHPFIPFVIAVMLHRCSVTVIGDRRCLKISNMLTEAVTKRILLHVSVCMLAVTCAWTGTDRRQGP